MPEAIIACSCRPVTCSAGTLDRQRRVHERARCPHAAAPVDAVRKSLMAAGAFTAAAARPESCAGCASAARSEAAGMCVESPFSPPLPRGAAGRGRGERERRLGEPMQFLHQKEHYARTGAPVHRFVAYIRVESRSHQMQNAEATLKRMSVEQLKTLLVVHRAAPHCARCARRRGRCSLVATAVACVRVSAQQRRGVRARPR